MLEKLDDFLFDKFPKAYHILYGVYDWVKLLIKHSWKIIKHIKCTYNGDVYIDIDRASWSFDNYLLIETLPWVLDILIKETHEEEFKQQLITMHNLCEEYSELDGISDDWLLLDNYVDRKFTDNGDWTIRYSSDVKPWMEKEYELFHKKLRKDEDARYEKRLAIQKWICIMLSKHLHKMWW